MGGGVVIKGGDGGTASTVAFSSSIGGAGGSITLQPGEEGVGAVYGPPGMVLLAPTSYYPTVGVGTNDPLSALDVRGGDVMVGLTSYPEAGLRSNSVFVANDNGDVHNQYRLDGNADTLYLIARSGTGSTHGTSITFRTGTAGTGENDRVTIDSNGLLSIAQLGGAGSTALCRNASNQIATCSSSIRYKENVNAFGGGLDVVRRLRPVTFRWKDGGTQDLGLIAEEVNKVEPLLTVYNAQGKVEGVKYDHLTVVLINAVEQLERENDSLRARLDRLEHVQK